MHNRPTPELKAQACQTKSAHKLTNILRQKPIVTCFLWKNVGGLCQTCKMLENQEIQVERKISVIFSRCDFLFKVPN